MLCSRCASSVGSDFVEPRAMITNRLGSYSEKLADLQTEILQIEVLMERLEKRRATLRRDINMLSPPSRIPPEILTEIFKLACQPSSPVTTTTTVVVSNNDDGQRPLTPLIFGSICKEWREIAWSTPLLWNSLSLHISRKTKHSQLHLLQDWLLRAKSSPLLIKLTMDDEHELNFCSLRAIMEVLATRSTYWSSLDSLLPSQCNDILRDNHFPSLTSVSIRPPKGTISTFSEPPNMSLSAPRLLDVDLSGYDFSGMVLPWNQLRRFKTQFLTVGECLKILDRSPNLKECHFEGVYSPEVFPLSSISTSSIPSTFLRSELQVLDVVLIKKNAISLLENVSLPLLTDLRIQYNGGPGSFFPALTALVIRSSCKLQSLQIEKPDFHEDDLIPCLEALSSLTSLRMLTIHALFGTVTPTNTSTTSGAGITSKLTTMLHPSYHSGNPLLPNLRTLEYSGTVRCDEDSLLALLNDRWRTPHVQSNLSLEKALTSGSGGEKERRIARLESLCIVSSDVSGFSDEFMGEVGRLGREGMDIVVRPS